MNCLFRFLIFFGVVAAFAHVEKMPDFMDKRDRHVYKTVQIGDQRWFAENLRFNIKGSFCYDKRDYNCDAYGRLYDWSMAMKLVDYYNWNSVKKLKKRVHDVCPVGWHVPTNKDWKKLKYYVGKKGKSDGVGISLKSQDMWAKELRLPAGSDEFGFGALPAGLKQEYGGFVDLGHTAQFWSSNEIDAGGAYYWSLMYDSRSLDRVYAGKSDAVSIRCVEDRTYPIKEPPPPPKKVLPQVVKIQDKEVGTIHIGDQVWMVNNLDVKVTGSFCYEDKEENCKKYGRLYTWAAAMKLNNKFSSEIARDSVSKRKPRGICPNGWHIPTALDFVRLDAYLKDIDDAVGVGTNLRSREGWLESDEALLGEDGFGFEGLASGKRDTAGAFVGRESFTAFWSGTEGDSLRALAWTLPYNDDDFIMDSSRKTMAYPVRCLMDPPDEDEIYDSTSIYDKRDDNRYKTIAVGETRWMAENLRFAAPGSFCYEDKDIRCRNYGRLYPWHVVMRLPEDYIENSMDSVSKDAVREEHQGICPEGWHIPRRDEWEALGQYAVNKRRGLGAALKSREGWAQGGAATNNVSGFNALPAGNRYSDGEFSELGSSAYFWAAEGGSGMGAAYWYLINSKDDFATAEDFDRLAFSLRCVKNKVVPVDTAKVVPADSAASVTAAVDSSRAVVDSSKTVPVDSAKTMSVDSAKTVPVSPAK